MSSAFLGNRSLPELAADSADDAFCPICLDPLYTTELLNTTTLACGHKLHSECAINFFRRGDTRCPCCRDDPYQETRGNEEFFDVLADGIQNRVTYTEALRAAMGNRIDKSTQRMKSTLRKWKKERRIQRVAMKEKGRIVTNLEDAVVAKVTAYEDKLMATFKKTHKAKIDAAAEARNAYTTATIQVRSSQTRLAKKYGFVGRQLFRSRRFPRRSELTGDDDEMSN